MAFSRPREITRLSHPDAEVSPLMTFHHATLPNGLDVIAELNDRAHSVAVGFFVKTGSRDESPELAGVSHFLEHMVFKGTPRRDALAVNRDFDKVGAKHNAQTSEEDTIYYVACLPEYLESCVDVLADILRPRLDADDFETEKQVILEEIHMYNDNPMMVAYEAAKAAHFGDHPLGHSVLGTVESISALRVEQMRDYFTKRYDPSNIVLTFAGNTTWDEARRLADRFCAGWPKLGNVSRQASPVRGCVGFQSLLRKEDHQQTLIGVSDGPPLESADRYAAAMLATILGDSSGSRLYWELIDPGYADAVDLSYQDFNQAGSFFTFLSCDPELAQENLVRVVELYRTFEAHGATADELEQARNKVLSRSVLRSERPMGRLMPLGYHWTYRREYVSLETEIERYQSVSVEDLARVAREYPLAPMTLVSVGPTTEITRPG